MHHNAQLSEFEMQWNYGGRGHPRSSLSLSLFKDIYLKIIFTKNYLNSILFHNLIKLLKF